LSESIRKYTSLLLDSKSSLFSRINNPATPESKRLTLLLSHFEKYVEVASDEDRELLGALILSVSTYLENNNAPKAIYNAFLLGTAVAGYQSTLPADNTTIINQLRKKFPLRARGLTKKAYKRVNQIIAGEIWEEDADEEIRIAMMVGIVESSMPEITDLSLKLVGIWSRFSIEANMLINVSKNVRPPAKGDIEKIVKEIAPDYASNPGRPMKNR